MNKNLRDLSTIGRKQQEPQMRVDLSQAEDFKCFSCGNYTFVPVVMMKKISALISPTGKEALVPIETFACNACGFINKEFLPVMPKTDESV